MKPEGKSRHHQKFQVDFFITFYVCVILELTAVVVHSSNQKFLKKIQNRISEKNGKKIVLVLHGIWVQNFKVGFFPSNFWIEKIKVVVFPSIFWKITIIWQFFRVILNFTQEYYYLENKVGVVNFTKASGLVKFQSPQALGRLENLLLPLYFRGNVSLIGY